MLSLTLASAGQRYFFSLAWWEILSNPHERVSKSKFLGVHRPSTCQSFNNLNATYTAFIEPASDELAGSYVCSDADHSNP
jgi:hypothetical protein